MLEIKAFNVNSFSLFPSHPEKPERISRIYDKHREWGILDRCLNVKVSHPQVKTFFSCSTEKSMKF